MRTLTQAMSNIADEIEMFLMNPAHSQPRCWHCHHLTHSERTEPTDTGRGHYYDSEFFCAFCKAERNEQMQIDLNSDVIRREP